MCIDMGLNFQSKMKSTAEEILRVGSENDHHHGLCAICLNKIVLQETALVKGCEHAYWFVTLLSIYYQIGQHKRLEPCHVVVDSKLYFYSRNYY